PRLPTLAVARIRAAALYYELAEDLIRGQNLLVLRHRLGDVGEVVTDSIAECFLHVIEVSPQVLHSEGSAEVRFVASREQLRHVTEVAQAVVDRRRSKHEKGLRSHRAVQEFIELIVARRLRPFLRVPPASRVPEVVRFVDYHYVGELGNPAESFREIALAAEVRMAENRQVAEVSVPTDTADVRKPLTQVGFPDPLLRCLRGE